MQSSNLHRLLSGVCIVAALAFVTSAQAQSLSFASADAYPSSIFDSIFSPRAPAPAQSEPMQLAPDDEGIAPDQDVTSSIEATPAPQDGDRGASASNQVNDSALPENLRRRIVAYRSNQAPGTIVIDTPHAYLYYVLGDGKAIRYGIGVGRKGFAWSGVRTVGRKAEWPDWIPPEDMIKRQPYLPRWVAGGPGNPLGARAMYLAGTEYRIHGTNEPSSIGKHVSSGCIRMLNADVEDLYNRVKIGTKVVVLPDPARAIVAHHPGTSVMTTASRN